MINTLFNGVANPHNCIDSFGADYVRKCVAVTSHTCRFKRYCIDYAKIYQKYHKLRDLDKNVLGNYVKFS